MATWQRWKNIMKCYPFEEKRLSKWAPPYIVQPKYDGVRCRAIRLENGSFILLSSEENIILSVPHLNRILEDRIKEPIELDGELYCHGMSFEQIVSITSRSVNLHEQSHLIQYHIFDIVNQDPQWKRLKTIETFKNTSPWLIISPFKLCESLDEIMSYYDSLINQSYEGIIVRHIDALYERKRSLYVMKFKPKQEDCYEILSTKEEIDLQGMPKDRLGALVCASGDRNVFSVGTGFSDEQRERLWSVRDLLVGEKCLIKYQHITSGNKVPRFPVFCEVKWNE